MFHNIPQAVRERMTYLEEIDARDRQDGTQKSERLRQIPPETGKFLALLLAGAPPGAAVEIGTSAGYSTLWLSLAGRPVTTFELAENKVAWAGENFELAGVKEQITLVAGDALQGITAITDIAFCFLDTEKELYPACYNLVVPRLVPGGLLAADNVLSHQADLEPFVRQAEADERIDALLVPIGKGILLCRKGA